MPLIASYGPAAARAWRTGKPPTSLLTILGSALIAWFDANDASTFTLSGANIQQWRSKVGSYTLVPNLANTITRSATARNSRAGVVYDGTNYLSCTDAGFPSGGAAGAIGVLAYNPSNSTRAYAMGYGNGSSASMRNLSNDGITNGIMWVENAADFGTGVPWASDAIAIGNVTASGNVDLSYQQSAAGGVTHGTPSVNTSLSTLYMGASAFITPWLNGGVIQEAFVANRAITSTERDKIEGHLAWKYNCVSALKATHPYKSSPP